MDKNGWRKCIFGKEFHFFFCQLTILRVVKDYMTDFVHNGMIYTPIIFLVVIEYVPLTVIHFYRKAILAFFNQKPTLTWSDG